MNKKNTLFITLLGALIFSSCSDASNNSDIKMYERFGELKIAIGNKKYKQVKEIIAKYPKLVNPPYPFTTNSTDSLLHFAAMNGDTKMTDLLLENGANLEINNKRNETPLTYAINYHHFDTAKHLIKKGANVKVIDQHGRSLLHLAADFGKPELIILLLENGAEINIKNNKGQTPYDIAFDKGNEKIVSIISKNGGVQGDNISD